MNLFQFFSPGYHLKKEEGIFVDTCVKEKHGLRFKSSSNDKGLWISNDDVKNYIKQMHASYGDTFC